MTLSHRRFLTLLFVVILFVIGPAIVLYGSGYRINFEKKRIERTGLLHVTTEPDDTTMVIDGQSHNVNKELVTTGLLPKDYDIIINKEGYHSWVKTLEIKAGESTFIRDVRLFKDSTPSTIETITPSSFFLSQKNQFGFFQSNNTLIVYNFKNEEKKEFTLPNAFEVINLEVYGNGDAVFQQNANWYIYRNEEITDLTITGVNSSIKKARVFEDNIYYLADDGIYQASLNKPEAATQIIQQNLPQDLLKKDQGGWLIATEPANQHSFLYSFYSKSSRLQSTLLLPFSREYHIANNYKGFLTIINDAGNNVYLADTNVLPAQLETLDGVHSWQWSDDQTKLLTANDFELIIYHFDNGQYQELLMRLSSVITDAAWHPEENHAFYVNEDKLYAVERDERGQRNITPLTETKKGLKILFVAREGEAIYLLSETNNGGIEILKLDLI